MQHAPLLGIELAKHLVERLVEAAFVAVVPKQNARMVHIPRHHFLDEFRADLVVVVIVPAREFIQHVKAEFVAQIKKLRVRRIMRHAHRIPVHVLDRVDIEPMHRLAQATS